MSTTNPSSTTWSAFIDVSGIEGGGPRHYDVPTPLPSDDLISFSHRASDLEHSLLAFLSTNISSLAFAPARLRSMEYIRTMLRADAWETTPIPWTDFGVDEFMLFSHLDALFFGSKLWSFVSYLPSDTLIRDQACSGTATVENYAPRVPLRAEIQFDTLNVHPAYSTWSRPARRSAIIATLLHELLHVWFFFSHANYHLEGWCPPCQDARLETVGLDGHGPSFYRVGRVLGEKLIEWIPEWTEGNFGDAMDPLRVDRHRPQVVAEDVVMSGMEDGQVAVQTWLAGLPVRWRTVRRRNATLAGRR
ncbi:MAG: hypothetical protein MMC23_001038 [Stictis urceolatum]|nr:hypothetical protein [Stictis urceolata]